jgi:HlyD family secretion protein
MRPNVTINIRFGILLAFLATGCGTALWGDLPQPKDGAKPAEAAGKRETAAKPPAEKNADEHDKGAKQDEGKAGEEKKDADEEKVPGHVNVRCVPARRLPFAITVDGLGRTEPLPESVGSLTAVVEGHVHTLLVKIGDKVKAGQPILQLDPTVAQASLAEKEANRDSLKAALKLLESLPRPEERRAAELAVETAKIGLEHDQAQVESLRSLLSHNDVSQKQFHDAEVLVKQAEVTLRTAEAQLRLMTLGPRPEAVAEAQTKIAMAEQAVASARAALDYHTLRAPIAGVVESLSCHPGQTLTIGTAVGEVVDTRSVFVTVYFPARTTRLLRPGMLTRVDLSEGSRPESESSAKDQLQGKVSFIGSAADPQTGNYAVRMLVENKDARLRLGQVVKATVVLRTEDSLLAVPEVAIFDQGEGPLLAVVREVNDREGKIKILHPELGPTDGGNVAVTKTDLKEGDLVVIEGAYNVPDDTAATILPEPPATSAEAAGDAKSKDTDSKAPEGKAPESKAGDSKAADAKAPDSKAPEAPAPAAKAGESKAAPKGGERE